MTVAPDHAFRQCTKCKLAYLHCNLCGRPRVEHNPNNWSMQTMLDLSG